MISIIMLLVFGSLAIAGLVIGLVALIREQTDATAPTAPEPPSPTAHKPADYQIVLDPAPTGTTVVRQDENGNDIYLQSGAGLELYTLYDIGASGAGLAQGSWTIRVIEYHPTNDQHSSASYNSLTLPYLARAENNVIGRSYVPTTIGGQVMIQVQNDGGTPASGAKLTVSMRAF